MNNFSSESHVREHARRSFMEGEVRVAPIEEIMTAQGWEGLIAWYNEYDIASGNPNPFTGDEEPTGKK